MGVVSIARIISDEKYELTPAVLGLSLPDETTIEGWARIGDRIRVVGRSMSWLAGDWLNFGEGHFGEEYAQFAENLGYDQGFLSVCQSVAGRFAVEQRNPDVSFSHYRLLTRFTDTQVAKWVERIVEGKLSVTQLRDLLAEQELSGETEEASRGPGRRTKISATWTKRLRKADAERIVNYLEREGATVKYSP